MKMKLKKSWLALLLVTTILTPSLVSCGCNGDNSSNGSSSGDQSQGTGNNSQGGGIDSSEDSGQGDVDIIPGGYLLYNSASEYKLVIPEVAKEDEITAAGEFAFFMNEATGYSFETVRENKTTYSEDVKYIYFGETSAAASLGIEADASELKATGYVLKTVNDSIFVVGATSTGTVYGTYDLLSYLVDYDCYAYDCVYVEKGVTEIPLYSFNEKFVPTIETRLPYLECVDRNGMVARRMKCTTSTSAFVMFNSQWVHTCDYILPYATYGVVHPSWYSSDATQWCFSEAYSNEEMFNTAYASLKAEVEAQPGRKYVSISQNDVNSWCSCPRCKAMNQKYGSDLAVLIPYLNKVAKKLKVDFPDRELYVHTFSYHKTSSPLTYIDEAVMCEPNVTIMFAPIRANYTTGFSDDSNTVTLAALKELAKICSYVTAWTYDAHFPQMFICNESFSGRQERYETLSENNVGFIFEQSLGATNQSFSVLKAYLTSKMTWDNSLNMDELIKDFCEKYYYTASDTILQYLDSYRTWAQYAYNQLGMHTDINGSNHLRADFWPKGKLLEWEAMFEQAYKDIEILKWTDKAAYELALKHITIESLTPRYLLIQLYGAQYDSAELDTMKRQFRADCYAYDVAHVREATSVEELFTNWGI